MPALPPPPAAIDPELVPSRKWLVFEDPDLDRWMAAGEVDVQNSDGSAAVLAVDDGSGGPVYLGTGTGVLFFRLDLVAGIATGFTGPDIDVALPADTATELYFQIATINSTTAADFTQDLQGPMRWQNSGQPGTWGTDAIVFTVDGSEIGRINLDRGMPIPIPGGQVLEVSPASYAPLSGVASAAAVLNQGYAFSFADGALNRFFNGTTDASFYVIFSPTTGDSALWDGTTIVAERPGGSTSTAAGVYASTPYGEATYNGFVGFTYTLT